MKRCELCKSLARIYCDSDRASLCWSCDSKVHSANFLVARHSRILLCHVCQSPTPWSASGEKLGPSTASVCERCVVDGVSDDDDDDRGESLGDNDEDDEYDGDEYVEDELELEDSVDENDNPVVPWSSTPPPPAASSSSSEEFSTGDGGVLTKRKRQNVADLSSEDDLDCSSANINHHTPSAAVPEAAIGDELTLLHSTPSSSETAVGKLKRFRARNMVSGDYNTAPVVGMSKATRTVGLDLNSSDSA